MAHQAGKAVETAGREEERKLLRGSPDHDLPIYTSVKHCSSRTGIPVQVLKEAREGGSPGFDNNRVNLQLILPNLFVERGVNWKQRLEEAKAKREDMKLRKELGASLNKVDVKSGISSAQGALFGNLERVLTTEMPALLKGLTEVQIRERLALALDKARENYQRDLEAILLVNGVPNEDEDLLEGEE